MRLSIAGINHFDPGCRDKLERWFRHQVAIASAAPAFVATEWNESAFLLVRSQRPSFRRMLTAEWPDASTALLDVLEQSLGYEGDAHVIVCPDAEVLWLAGPSDAAQLQSYANDRFNMYKGFLAGSPLPADPVVAIRNLGAAARVAARHDGDSQRDQNFAVAIMDRAVGHSEAWSAIVVGANHAADNDWSMRRVLQDSGYACDVSFM
jgi:hypothetical protein